MDLLRTQVADLTAQINQASALQTADQQHIQDLTGERDAMGDTITQLRREMDDSKVVIAALARANPRCQYSTPSEQDPQPLEV